MTAKEYFTFRRDQIEIDAATSFENRRNQINSYSPDQLQTIIVKDAEARRVEPEDSDVARSAYRNTLLEDLAVETDRTKKSLLNQVAADEKERQKLISQIEPGSWVTIHWLLPFRQDGARKQRPVTISGVVESVQLDRAQVSFRVNSRPDDDEIKLHKIEKDALVEAPLDSVTSVSL